MMSLYRNSNAVWAAATDRAKRSGLPVQEAQQWFLRERLLSRVFADPDSPWVLKGGTAMLARVADARWSRDVDLLTQKPDLASAVLELQRAAAREDEDQLTMTVTDTRRSLGTRQGSVAGTTLHVQVTSGSKQLAAIKIDLVAGSLMTGDPERSMVRSRLHLPGLESVPVRLYPVADHIADKVIATESTFGLHPSSRVRDLVDLVILGRTQTVKADDLQRAIAGERIHQGMPMRTAFTPPADWTRTFAEAANKSAVTQGLSLEAATAYVRNLVEPAMNAEADLTGRTWDPTAGAYLPSEHVTTRPQPEPEHEAGNDKPVTVVEHTRNGSLTLGHRRNLPNRGSSQTE